MKEECHLHGSGQRRKGGISTKEEQRTSLDMANGKLERREECTTDGNNSGSLGEE